MRTIKEIKDLLIEKGRDESPYESYWEVEILDSRIRSKNFEDEIRTLELDDLVEIKVVTNDSGPWGIDFWWKLESASDELLVPNGALGEAELSAMVLRLETVDTTALTKAIRSGINAEYVIWKKNVFPSS